MDPYAYAPSAGAADTDPDTDPGAGPFDEPATRATLPTASYPGASGLPAGYAYSQPDAFAAAQESATPFRSTAHRTSAISVPGWGAVALLVTQACLALMLTALSAWSSVSYASASAVQASGPGVAQPVAAVVRGAGEGALLLVWPLSGLAFAVWLFVALRNVRAWGHPLRRGPGWSFGAWFVPVVQWWWPKQLVDDAWKGSRPDVPDGLPLRAVPTPGVTAAWWLLWLAAPVVLQVGWLAALRPVLSDVMTAASLGLDPTTVVDLAGLQETVALWSVWAYALWTLCALLAAYVVGQVTAWQSARLRETSPQAATDLVPA